MGYRATLILAIGGTIALVFWLSQNLEPVEIRESDLFQGDALRNPYFAAEEFLTRSQIPARTIFHVDQWFPLPDRDVVMIVPAQRTGLGPERHQELVQWARSGGHLIVVAGSSFDDEDNEVNVSDPLLAPFGAYSAWRGYDDDEDGWESDDDGDFGFLRLGGGAINVRWERAYWELNWDEEVAVERSYRVAGVRVGATFNLGAGRISAFTDLQAFDNYSLQSADNAAGLLHLLWRYGERPAGAWIVLSDDMPSLFAWLGHNAMPLLCAAAVLLVLWLWRGFGRFGPITPQVDLTRRSLRRHLLSAGQYYFRNNFAARLTNAARRRLWGQLRHECPDLPEDFDKADLRAIAQETERTPENLERAFKGSCHTQASFVATMRALQRENHPPSQ